MLDVLFWIMFSLMLLVVIPDRWNARQEMAKRQREYAESLEGRARAAMRACQQERTERIARDGRAERWHPERRWEDA